MKIHWIQHVSFEGLGNIEEWINSNNHHLTCTKQHEGDKLPSINSFDMLIVMGGPMGVYDTEKYAWLQEEITFVKTCIELNKPVLGICLGSQFIAAALGAKVYPGTTKEIGWFPINIKENIGFNVENPVVFHWHGDTFDLPENAILLASTNEVPNQAFSYKKSIGFQFHLEQTEETIKGMIDNCGDELMEDGVKIQSPKEIINQKDYFASNKKAMFKILSYISDSIDN